MHNISCYRGNGQECGTSNADHSNAFYFQEDGGRRSDREISQKRYVTIGI